MDPVSECVGLDLLCVYNHDSNYIHHAVFLYFLLPHSQLICIPNLYKGHFTGNMLLIFKVAKFAKVCVGLSHITHLYNNTSVEEHVVENVFE